MRRTKNGEKLNEKPISNTWAFLKSPDLKEEEKLVSVGKWAIFLLLIFFEIVIIAQHTGDWLAEGQWLRIGLTIFVEMVLTGVEATKLFKTQNFSQKLVWYVLDFVSVFMLVIITSSAFLVILYLLVLTEIYVTTEKLVPATMIFAVCIPVYVVLYAGALFFRTQKLSIFELLASSSTAIVALTLHFLIVNFVMMFYRQYVKLERTLKELDESKMELQKAYDELEEVTVLKERQRIAKDIHDTAGHSITTVIMQTETAKLILDENPSEAKNKLIAANLQAKNALKELRDSVHLLSGRTAKTSLKEALEAIVRESMDGTGITIRYAIEDVTTTGEVYRFICNTLKEGISNGLRHGKATAFWLELRVNEQKIEFLLSDNGCGASVGELKCGLGLSGMKDQAEKLGGELSFSSEIDEGFELSLVLPLELNKE